MSCLYSSNLSPKIKYRREAIDPFYSSNLLPKIKYRREAIDPFLFLSSCSSVSFHSCLILSFICIAFSCFLNQLEKQMTYRALINFCNEMSLVIRHWARRRLTPSTDVDLNSPLGHHPD
ncbi:hypothetical protein RRG08_020337 [Elysia crispata]|uniref:Uncharacterized protein n=1 Tax=Elysia crispata TaxID=231223 RepID=A0AAE1DX37_9GAST|nr:hypothetical protein RRG08_020337 [Elysia crispata]